MREILFRGKRADNGEWVEGDLLQTRYHSGHIEYQIMPQTPVSSAYPVIPETVGQYTGCHDKYQDNVFENDIVWDEYNERYGIVEFELGEFVVNFLGVIDCDRFDDVINCCRVVGNIHDNPELLGEEDT